MVGAGETLAAKLHLSMASEWVSSPLPDVVVHGGMFFHVYFLPLPLEGLEGRHALQST